MALRHKFPFRVIPDLRMVELPVKPPPVMREPKLVEFRPEADLDAVVDTILKYARVKVSAATGAGKSTRLPVRMARKMQKPVFLVVPATHLAQSHYSYLSTMYPGEVHIATQEADVLAGSGVTVTTYAWVVGKMIVSKGNPAPFGKCVMFADEVHESDAFSYVSRTLSSNIPGCECFVEVSATHDPARMPMREPKGKTETRFFPRMPPNQWKPMEDGYPWSFNSLTGNTLIFVDDEKEAKRLVSDYSIMGVSAYRLHSRMSEKESEVFTQQMNDADGSLVIGVADYSFRNGGTFNVTTIIDSALVRKTVVKGSQVAFEYRLLYELEKYQTCSRGSRTEGSSCVYWIPEATTFPSAQCMLEGAEAEVAGLLLRLLGYAAPPALVPLLTIPVDRIPRDLYSMLTGFLPLAAVAESDFVSALMPKPVLDTTVVAEVLDSYGYESSPVATTTDLFASMDLTEPAVVGAAVSATILDELQMLSSASRTLEPGYYYACSEAKETGALGVIEWDILLQALYDRPMMITGYTTDMRKDAVAKFLLHYNSFVAQNAAVTRVGAHKDTLGKAVRMYPEQVKVWSHWLSDKARNGEAMSASLLKMIDKLRTPGMVFTQVMPNADLEEAQARAYVKPLLDAVARASQAVDTDAFFGQIGAELGYDPGPAFPAIQERERTEDFSESGVARWRTVKVAGAVMHDMVFTPHNALQWTQSDYVQAVVNMLVEKGVVPKSIRRLTIDAPGVDCDRIMQAVRDSANAKTRLVKYEVVKSRAR